MTLDKALRHGFNDALVLSGGCWFPVSKVDDTLFQLELPYLLQEITGYSHINMVAVGRKAHLSAVYLTGLHTSLCRTDPDKELSALAGLALALIIKGVPQ